MLDDMGALRAAVEGYRAARTAAGLPTTDGDAPGGRLPVEALCRVFDVDRFAEQPLWLTTQPWLYDRVLPCGAHMLPWTDGDELLSFLSFAVATPFPWRHQVPVFFIDHLVFTVVLAGERAGEVWRYQIDPDDWNPLRAAPSLAALFAEWTKGFAAGVFDRSPYDDWLHIGYDGGDPVEILRKRGLDPFAFPVYVSAYRHEDLVRARQRDCGVDIARADDFETHEGLNDEIDAARATLRR
ncbi:hypothetical protein AB0J74_22180 [Asanoa sp. NPDC049573]|uniref:hypothetical protein n=1 Tax=Asanoa sp. NPDC049573 TaxID=3155396 RepID=UPI00341DA584